jgi:outer membrane receptor protein involved in Fe transport
LLSGGNKYLLDGEQRHRGIELNAFGKPMPGLRLNGGTYIFQGEPRTVKVSMSYDF